MPIVTGPSTISAEFLKEAGLWGSFIERREIRPIACGIRERETSIITELSKAFTLREDLRGVIYVAGLALVPPSGGTVRDGWLVRS